MEWDGSRLSAGFGALCTRLSDVAWFLQVSSYPSLVGAEAQEEFLRVLSSMCQKLRSVQYNGSYFDRGAKGGGRLCTLEGWFSCQVSCVPFILGPPGWPAECSPLGRGGRGPSALGLPGQSLVKRCSPHIPREGGGVSAVPLKLPCTQESLGSLQKAAGPRPRACLGRAGRCLSQPLLP